MMPLLFGIIGGLIVWVAKKNDDPTRAKRILMLGIVISLLYLTVLVHSQIQAFDREMRTPLFLRDANYTIHCDRHFFQSPTNCMIQDQHGVPITEDAVNRMSTYCLYYNGDGYLPCDTGGNDYRALLFFPLVFIQIIIGIVMTILWALGQIAKEQS